MKRDEVIKLAEEWLKSVPDLKKRLRLIDMDLKKSSNGKAAVEKLKLERDKLQRDKLQRKLSRIIKAVSTLEDDNQRIICYRYFEKLTYKEVALRVHLGERTVYSRMNKLLLRVGRIMFGFEEEFFKALCFD